ncbi:radical SAM protein [Pseudemcibacter aquimaris]|uniref:radical SAM protein n=1 Tax=Pseudemcibacter aquimaris TaxID=2857064 RepID=UPI0020115DC9|nr:radical SAM protein [Pseudemcibacter aquimaris]MCC3862410.1 radical SAM protein [Pseudemcibacter aquimaris]WDU59160.1 radical SAM protein [Pseudemcibacter aquimaris]
MDKLNSIQGKFCDPEFTKDGSPRAHVGLKKLETLWFNTGTLCNLTCVNCYIESSPTNDALVYISHDEVLSYLDEIKDQNIPTAEIGLTGGEPFMNPDIIPIMESALEYGFNLLVLTNAMKPMMRHTDALLRLNEQYGDKLSIRVSTDHYTKEKHQDERGERSWDPMLLGLKWLSDNGFDIHVAGRTFTHEDENDLRSGYQTFFDENDIKIDASNPHSLILFPEMNEKEDVTEITSACWDILGISPSSMMCATSRMVVKHKGAKTPAIMACTLLPYDSEFNMGEKLGDMRDKVSLNHPHCSTFCVLGGASCSN